MGNDEFYQELKDELKVVWQEYDVPDFHKIAFLECIQNNNKFVSGNQFAPVLVKEIDDIRNERSPIQNARRALTARESCIQQIKELDQQLSQFDNQFDENNESLRKLNDQQQHSHF